MVTERATGSFAVLHGLYWLAVNMAESAPLMLAVDDVQWCDNGSLRYLAFLVRRLEGVPVLVVATLRTGEGDEDDGLLAELALEPTALVLRPAPLAPEATASIVAGRLGAPDSPLFTAACHRTTAGNPLAAAPAAAGAGSRRCPPGRCARRHGGGGRVAGGIEHGAHAPEPAAAGVHGGGAGGGGARRRRPLPAWPSLAGVAEPTTAAALACWPAPRSSRTSTRWRSCTRCGRRRLPRVPAAQRELWHERAAQVLPARGQRRTARVRTCCSPRAAPSRTRSGAARLRRGRRPTGARPTAR